MSGPGIIASNFRRIDKGHLVGAVDLAIPAWSLLFRGCLWHRRNNGTEKIFFASSSWTDDSGQRHHTNNVEITDPQVWKRFQTAALDAVHAIAEGRGP